VGAVAVESGWDVATRLPNGWSQRYHTELWQLFASRPLIESTVLELCRRLHKVTILERTEVTALRTAGETRRYCTGVEVLSRDDGQTRTLDADLVVDASGAHSRAAEWLRQLELQFSMVQPASGSSLAARLVVESGVPAHGNTGTSIRNCFLPDRESALAAQLYRR
jgi:2-polyprenyl-6-methoxyphenol hydroxylase-like FAD-dependent oxidoreductase